MSEWVAHDAASEGEDLNESERAMERSVGDWMVLGEGERKGRRK